MKICNVYRLGLVEYYKAYELQRALVDKRLNKKVSDTLLLLEHTPTITIGKSGKTENIIVPKEILAENNISLHFTDRGGDATYHGPGQLVGYLILDLSELDMTFHEYIYNLEQTIIDTLKVFDIESFRKDNYRGVWTKNGKIASIGIRIIKTVTMHGFALNVNPNLQHFKFIIPCGIKNERMTSFIDLDKDAPMIEVMDAYENSFSKIFKYEINHVTNLAQ